ncbi:N-acetylglucosaminyldiphosphoundecaprenol N-acetyl-beta-D-mannosaminyltransferase [Georgenia soli]|uniref:N-acetylglucosaminyldiphosphoundecaprenol N-acetyl-beta-D-mannosaminyltransferase n=1 Tax=Georgenia soli TaxID=638953 RepID=A0A2A9EKQ3_9MICO|nr:WecB/TagA/CpsF family glycosyltransferase [Georgenia soli]PFG38835.1 N-acetylglucosaminyldiphosphoundecaprenol N-acetyl-beta-D-mannosaminyltransferase [Georgenia soli]
MTDLVRATSASTRLLFGLPLDAATRADVVAECSNALSERRRLLIGVLNAAKVVNLRRDPLLRDSLLDCDLLLADGQSVVWASHLLGSPLPERVAGIDLFVALLELAEQQSYSVYLLGARREVLDRLLGNLEERYPNLRIAGARDGYFSDDEAADVAREIRDSGADMLFLGMVSPKKEIFLASHGSTLGVPVLHGVGGSFDVLAGITRRAPERWQRLGLEWAYRLLQEPRRMWRRYLRTNTGFLLLLLRELIRPAAPLQRAVRSS